jgi:peptide/nickel transport system permease protein
MLRYIARRLIFVIINVLLMSFVIFTMTRLLKGDVADMIMSQYATEEGLRALRESLGLNRPAYVQYFDWLGHFIAGDWGMSLATHFPVRPMVMERLGNSIKLAAVGLVMLVFPSIALGVLAGFKKRSWIDHLISISALAFVGLPEFVIGMFLILIFAVKLKWVPSIAKAQAGSGLLEVLRGLVLPGFTVSLILAAYVIRMTRSSVIEVLKTAYVRTAVLKGLPRRQLVVKHVLRNALLPTVTVIAMSIGWLVGGLIVTESVFSYPGLGRLLLWAVQRRDIPLIEAISMVIVTVVGVANLSADVLYALLNPRIRLS